jgi:hypothetical protein
VQFNPNQLQGGGGSGLGMVLSRGIVEAHGGSIWLTSEGLGKGCTFAFALPISNVNDLRSEGVFGLRETITPSLSVADALKDEMVIDRSRDGANKKVVSQVSWASVRYNHYLLYLPINRYLSVVVVRADYCN